jgi:hypothetical protein
MGKTFPSKLLQTQLKTACDTGYFCVGIIMKDNFLWEPARVFPPDGFLQGSQQCAVMICFQHCPVFQGLGEENALCVPECCQWHITCKLHSLELLSHGECGMFPLHECCLLGCEERNPCFLISDDATEKLWGRYCWQDFGTHRTFSLLNSWTTRQQWLQTTAAKHCCAWRKPSRWNTVACSQRKWTDHLHGYAHPRTPMSQPNFYSSFAGNVLPIHHTDWTFHPRTSTSLD